MIDSRDENLLHGRLDEALGPDETTELQARLDESHEARERAAQLERLAGLIDELKESNPPPGLVRGVMAQVAPRVVAFNRHRTVQGTGGGAMSKKVMWGVAAAAAMVLGVFAIKGISDAGFSQALGKAGLAR